jgi:hypothetical protein
MSGTEGGVAAASGMPRVQRAWWPQAWWSVARNATVGPNPSSGQGYWRGHLQFAEAAPATGVGSATESETEEDKEETANNNHCRYGSGQSVVEAPICQFPVHL